MKPIGTQDIISRLDRIERLLLADLLQSGRAKAKDLKPFGFTERDLYVAKKAVFDFDVTKYVPGSHVKQWK